MDEDKTKKEKDEGFKPLDNDEIHDVSELEDIPDEGDIGYTPEEMDTDAAGLSNDATTPDQRVKDIESVTSGQDSTDSIEKPEDEDSKTNMEE